MQAHISKWQEWKDGSSFPVLRLSIDANREDQKEELEALKLIERAVSDIVGRAYGNKLVSTQEGSGQRGIFVVDLTGVLTLLKALQEKKDSKDLARAWIINWLKKKIKPEWLPAVKKETAEVFTCRCRLSFKGTSGKKKFIKHQKRCQVLKELSGFFERCEKVLRRINHDKEGKKHSGARKVGKTRGHKSREVTFKSKDVDSRAKTRRASRDSNSRKKR
jgi:hypothetical protein